MVSLLIDNLKFLNIFLQPHYFGPVLVYHSGDTGKTKLFLTG